MKTLFMLLLIAAALCAGAGCLRKDTRTETFHIESLQGAGDVAKLDRALRSVEGVIDARFDLSGKTATVIFNGRVLYLKNIEDTIVRAGYGLPNNPVKK